MQYKQLNLWGELEDIEPPKKKFDMADYDNFVEKFKGKKTTEDCYTPDNVYEAVLGWVKERCNLGDRPIVRPFYPNGDFVRYEYPENCVVVDNPPFSILAQIVRFYNERNIDYFLWCPSLVGIRKECTLIVVDVSVVYHNGAKVNSGFCSNMFGDTLVMTAPDLRQRVASANQTNIKRARKQLIKYSFPDNVLRVNDLNKICKRGVEISVSQSEGVIRSSVCNTNTFGNSILISDSKAKEKVEAMAKEKVEAINRECANIIPEILELTYEEKQLIKGLNDGV